MKQEFTVTVMGGYVHLVDPMDARITRESARKRFKKVGELCRAHDLSNVLVEWERIDMRMGIVDLYELSGVLLRLRLIRLRVAFCLPRSEDETEGAARAMEERMTFFKTACGNRGVEVAFFNDRDAALRWLLNSHQERPA